MSGDSAIWWPAPAKLNLFLHITGQREDGYHELQTLFQLLDYADQLQFQPNDSGEIRRSSVLAQLPAEQDIVVKAARLLARHSGSRLGVEIALQKRIPMGAGLGGGSSDAATTLLALNRIWELDYSAAELSQLGLQLGADVPVFVQGNSAWAEGVGEHLQPVELPPMHYLVVTPPVHVSTASMFAESDLTRDHEAIKIRDYFSGAECGNDFEPVLCRRYPEIAEALHWLSEASGEKARVSGSGASLFVAMEDPSRLRQIAKKLPDSWSGFVARGLNHSPIHEIIKNKD